MHTGTAARLWRLVILSCDGCCLLGSRHRLGKLALLALHDPVPCLHRISWQPTLVCSWVRRWCVEACIWATKSSSLESSSESDSSSSALVNWNTRRSPAAAALGIVDRAYNVRCTIKSVHLDSLVCIRCRDALDGVCLGSPCIHRLTILLNAGEL